jgi:hypothetical protein
MPRTMKKLSSDRARKGATPVINNLRYSILFEILKYDGLSKYWDPPPPAPPAPHLLMPLGMGGGGGKDMLKRGREKEDNATEQEAIVCDKLQFCYNFMLQEDPAEYTVRTVVPGVGVKKSFLFHNQLEAPPTDMYLHEKDENHTYNREER